MAVKTMEDLLAETLEDIYYAEKQILEALPGMVGKAADAELEDALEAHRRETVDRVDRLEQAFKLIATPTPGERCEAIEGILAEATEHMGEIEDEKALDAPSPATRLRIIRASRTAADNPGAPSVVATEAKLNRAWSPGSSLRPHQASASRWLQPIGSALEVACRGGFD